MQKKRMLGFILAMASCMLVFACFFSLKVDSPLYEHIIFSETIHGQTLEPYYDETEDTYYLFLPAYVSEDEIKIKSSGLIRVEFSDETENYGKNLEGGVPLSQDVTMTLKNFGQIETYNIQIWQCENIPTLYIETESGNLDYVNEDKTNEEQTTVVMINADGTVEYNGTAEITGRGNGTWTHEKKPYNLEFTTNISVWGFEDVDKLCLLTNFYDYSDLRNAIVYYAARENGIPYTSNYQFVDFYANGNYLGLYGVATKEEYKKHIEEDEIAAVFELNINANSEDTFVSEFGTPIEVMYGSKAEVKDVVNKFEDALFNYDYEKAYDYIDIESFAKDLALNEFFVNFDTNWYSSQYFYIDKSGIMHSMCAWDFDLTFGFSTNTKFYNNQCLNEITTYFANHRNGEFWYEYLIHDETFCNYLVETLKNDYNTTFCDQLDGVMNFYISEINNSRECNNIRWKNVLPINPTGNESLESFYDLYSDLIHNRQEFLVDYFANQGNYCLIRFISDPSISDPSPSIKTNLCIPYGQRLSSYLKGYTVLNKQCGDYILLGWTTEDRVSVYDIDKVTEDLTFYGEWEKQDVAVTPVTEKEEPVVVEISFEESTSPSEKFVIQTLKKVYHFFGLESFDRKALVIGAVFVFILVGLFIEEMIRTSKRRR